MSTRGHLQAVTAVVIIVDRKLFIERVYLIDKHNYIGYERLVYQLIAVAVLVYVVVTELDHFF